MLAGSVPCPPFTIAGKQLGAEDERDLFPEAIRIIEEAKPAAVMLENVPGFATAKFAAYRCDLMLKLRQLGYEIDWKVLNASDYGVPQLRPRFVLVALLHPFFANFRWPTTVRKPPLVGQVLVILWHLVVGEVRPNGVIRQMGLPQRSSVALKSMVGLIFFDTAKEQWKILGVDGKGIADLPPGDDFPVEGYPAHATYDSTSSSISRYINICRRKDCRLSSDWECISSTCFPSCREVYYFCSHREKQRR